MSSIFCGHGEFLHPWDCATCSPVTREVRWWEPLPEVEGSATLEALFGWED